MNKNILIITAIIVGLIVIGVFYINRVSVEIMITQKGIEIISSRVIFPIFPKRIGIIGIKIEPYPNLAASKPCHIIIPTAFTPLRIFGPYTSP
jgi:hypothetical protein